MPAGIDLLLIAVVIAAFIAGYLIVSFIINKVKALNARPPMHEGLKDKEVDDTETRGDSKEEEREKN